MPTCAICEQYFSSYTVIKGMARNLGSRKFCLNCSPFGKHNTTDPRWQKAVLTCQQCGRVYRYSRTKGHSRKRCNSCIADSRRPLVKQRAIAYKGGKCQVCGYNRTPRSLGFHHTNPAKKDFGIGANTTRSWNSVRKELDKCVLVCANCHGEIHDGITIVPADSTTV